MPEKSQHGTIIIDNRESPGIIQSVTTTRGPLQPFVGANRFFISETNTCMHCDAVVIRNPNRTRARGHCRSCDYFICDPCDAEYFLTSECKCREKRFEQVLKGVT